MENVHKKLLIQAAACNLALLMRALYGAGKPKAAHDQAKEALFVVWLFIIATENVWEDLVASIARTAEVSPFTTGNDGVIWHPAKSDGLDTGC